MKFRWQRGWGGNRRSLPYLVFFLSLAATVCAWVWAGLIIGTQDVDRFRAATEEAESAIKSRIDDEEDLVRAGAATFALQNGWTKNQFHVYVDNLNFSRNYKGSEGLGYVKRTKAEDAAALERSIHAEGVTAFAIHPNLPNKEFFPIVYFEPSTPRNLSAIGFDAFSDPVRREAMQSSRDLGQPILSKAVNSEKATTHGRPQTSFDLYCPIYAGGEAPDTPEERRQKLVGFVFSEFRASDIFRDVLEGQARRDLNIEIFEGQTVDGVRPLYRSTALAVGRRTVPPTNWEIPVAGRQWTIRYYPSLEFEQQSASWLVSFIPVVGLLVSLLLGAVSFSQVRAYNQLGSQAETLVRRESHQRLLANVGATLVDSGATDQNIRAVCRLVVDVFVDWFAVWIFEPNGSNQSVFSSHSRNLRLDAGQEVVLRELVLKYAFGTEKPTTFELAITDDPSFRSFKEANIRSIAVVPMLNRGGTTGIVVAGRSDAGFQEDDIRLLEQIASRTSLAVEGVRLFEEKEQELEERRKVEAQIRQLNENLELIVHERTTELQATNKELEAFCYSVSHDLRAPLRSVDGFSKSLLEDYGGQLDEQARDYISRVRNASHRMDELISALLNLSRITRLEIARQQIDISQMAAMTVEDVLEGHDRDRFTVTIQSGMTADADPKLIRVVLDNLIRNAVKFSSISERAKVEIGHDGKGFYVRDNGVGFNPAYAEKLFVAFERLHTQTEFPGSGIGLATVFRIIQKHGGNVWAKSEEGKGAVFYFTVR